MDQIQPYLDYFSSHPDWALIIIFLIAFGEALLVIGLFVPSTAVLVGAGTLVGAGKLPFWPVLAATIFGCILGDQVSYWAGRIYGERLKTFWPLNRYPHLLAKGEEFFKKNGGKSIALGRFVPGVKAVVPGIAGMFGMSEGFFLAINVSSGIVWGFAHVFPGVLLGQALSLAGELSGRLLFVLLVLLVILAVAGWLIRLLAASLTPYRKAVQGRFAAWAGQSQNDYVRRFAEAIAPEHPSSVLLLMLLLGLVLAVVALIDLLSGLVLRQAVSNLDISINNVFSQLRSPPGDELMQAITMLGDEVVVWFAAAALLGWLAWQKAWRAAIAAAVTMAAGRIILLLTSFSFSPPSNVANASAFHFPSEHALLAGLVFGVLAVLCNHSMARWTQAIVAATCALVVIAIAFTRLYLGVNWLSDVLGGVLIAVILTSLYGVFIATLPRLRIKPIGLICVTFLAFAVAGSIHLVRDDDQSETLYAPQNNVKIVSLADWKTASKGLLPSRRIDLAGKPKESFVVQWIGSLDALQAAITPLKFKPLPVWTLRDSLAYLNPHAPLDALAPRPALHDGLKAKLTAIKPLDGASRLTLRAFESNVVAKGATDQPVYLVSVTHETLHSQFGMYALPMGEQIHSDEAANFLKALKENPAIETINESQVNNVPVVTLRPKN
ncbi:MAG: VTT domain-containing protein [Alphaproteobacteria bacterium]|nr:VTT domain-containing protein [Alphaproteobacteria bacterium]